MEQPHDGRNPIATLAVGAAGSGYSFLELPWDKFVAIATFIYVVLQVIKILPEVPGYLRRIAAWFQRSKRE